MITAGSERVERDAHRDVLRAVPAAAVDAGGMEVFEVAGAVCTCMLSEPSLAAWNRVVGLGVDEPVTPRILDGVERFYADRGAGFAVQGSVPGLEGRGYLRESGAAVFERAVERVNLADSPFVVIDAADGEEFGTLRCAGWAGSLALLRRLRRWRSRGHGRPVRGGDRWLPRLRRDARAAAWTRRAARAVGRATRPGISTRAGNRRREHQRGPSQRVVSKPRANRLSAGGLTADVASCGEMRRRSTRALRFNVGSLSVGGLVAAVARRFGAPLEWLTSPDRLREWLHLWVTSELSHRRGSGDRVVSGFV